MTEFAKPFFITMSVFHDTQAKCTTKFTTIRVIDFRNENISDSGLLRRMERARMITND